MSDGITDMVMEERIKQQSRWEKALLKLASLPSIETLKSMLSYDPDTGIFRWAVKPSIRVSVGDVAGSFFNGYIRISINGKQYKAHRLAWLYHYGEYPEGHIDHINGIRQDNRISNLRLTTISENNKNRNFPSVHNKTGILGVIPRENGKFQAQFRLGGNTVYLGTYETPEEALAAYNAAKKVYFVLNGESYEYN